MPAESLSDGLRETLAVFDRVAVPLTTPEVAERLDLGRRSAYDRLERLVDRDELETKKVGAGGRVWWRPAPAPTTDRRTGRPDSRAGVTAVLDHVLGDAPVGAFLLDDDREVAWANGAAEESFGLDAGTAVGRDHRRLLEDATAGAADDSAAVDAPVPVVDPASVEEFATDATGGPKSDDAGSGPADIRVPPAEGREERWLERLSVPIDSGPYAGGRIELYSDVTARRRAERERERRLRRERARSDRRYRTLFESIDQGYCVVEMEYDDDGNPVDYRFLETNPAFEAHTGIADAEGRSMREIEPDHEQHWFDVYGEVARTGEPIRFEAEADALIGGWYDVYAFPFGVDGRETVAVLFDDVTDRKERERELEEYRHWNQTLIENFPAGAVALVDRDLRYVTFAGSPEGDTTVTRSDLEGAPVRDALPDRIADVVVPGYEAALAGEPSEFEDTIDGRVYQFHFAPVRDDDGEVFAVTGMSQDVTERQEREEALRDAKLQLEAATEAGAVGTWEWKIPEDRFVTGPTFAKTFDVDPENAREGTSLDEFLGAIHEVDRDRVERLVEEAVASCGEYEAEYRVRNASGELRWVVARGHVHCDEDGVPITFPGALTDITERKRAERELERQREQLAALNSLHEVFQDITDAVIERSTRAEIEDAVCEGLAGVDSFSFAWIGEVDPATQTLVLRTEAGVEGYLDGVTVSVDPDDERSRGPGGRAFLTREVQVARDAPADLEYEPWLEHVDDHGVRSIAGVPIVYEGRVYGVLAVYSARPDAFSDAERRLLGQLGEVVGHAIAAVERKRALMSDEVTELEFRINDVFAAAGVDSSVGGRISLDRAVPANDGEFLVYGVATEDAWAGFRELVDAVPHWTGLSRLGEAWDGNYRFELRTIEPPMLSVVATLGGHVETALIEDGDCRLVIRLPPGGDVGAVAEAVTANYPTAELLAQRQFTRSAEDAVGLDRLVHEALTDRQRAAVEAALYSGFFEWPRDSSGEDVADALGVSPPTFHQHLRKAERTVFASLLSADV